MTLKTLADVRRLIERHLPGEFREKSTWRYVAEQLAGAAHGGDVLNVAVPLQMVLSLEGVSCRPG